MAVTTISRPRVRHARRLGAIAVAVGLTAAWFAPSAPAAPGTNWQDQSANMPAGEWNDVAYGNNRFVAVNTALGMGSDTPSAAGDVERAGGGFDPIPSSAYSLDGGITWTASTSEQDGFRNITFGAGRFVAVGNANFPSDSVDGDTWTNQSSIVSEILVATVYTGSQFVVLGNSGAVQTSSDGLTWTPATTIAMSDLRSIAYGDGRLMAINGDGNIATSDDNAGTWDMRGSPGPGDWKSVAYGGGHFVAVDALGQLSTSDDGGASWSNAVLGSSTFADVAFGNATFAAPSQNEPTVHTSSGNGSWSPSVAPAHVWKGVAFGEGHFVAVGDNAAMTSFEAPTITLVAPASGSPEGGNVVTITGTHLGGATTVTIGGLSVSFVVISDTEIQATVPPGPLGTTVDVAVTTAYGSATAPAAYTYVDTPAEPEVLPTTTTVAPSTTVPAAPVIDLRSVATTAAPAAPIATAAVTTAPTTASPSTTVAVTTSTTTTPPTSTTTVPARLALAPGIYGIVYTDVNRNQIIDNAEFSRDDLVARLFRGSKLLATSGTPYDFGTHAPGSYQVRFYEKVAKRLKLVATRSLTVNADGTITG